MHLKRIEISQFGIFREPVRIEGIGPGLNVLAGPNELGKSTVLRGLMALFFEAHKTAKKEIKRIRPYQGGAPRVAALFELSGREWRLEKQFLASHMAALECTNGNERHLGADAENRLAELLDSAGDLRSSLPLAWVAQGESFEVPEVPHVVRQSLGQILAQQVDKTTGIGPAQEVLRRAEVELGTQLTEKTGQPRKGGAYEKLLRKRDRVRADLECARQRMAAAEVRLEQLGELQREEAELTDEAEASELKNDIAECVERLKQAEDARHQVGQLGERIVYLEQQLKQRKASLSDYDDGLAERDALQQRMQTANGELAELLAAAEKIDGQLRVTTAEFGADQAREEELRSHLEGARQAKETALHGQRLAELSATIGRLVEIGEQLVELKSELGQLDWPPSTIKELRRAVSERDQLMVRKTASAPRVSVKYSAGRSDGFSIDDKAIADGGEVIVEGRTTIKAAGIGAIDIVPGAMEELADINRAIIAQEHEVALLLEAMGAEDIAGAEMRETRRNELLQRKELLLAEQHTKAPDGEAVLIAEHGEREALIAQYPDHCAAVQVSADDVHRELLALSSQLKAAAQRREALVAQRGKLDERRAGLATELRMWRTRREELDARYDRAEGEADPRDELVEQVEAGELELNVAVRERLALGETALAADGMAALTRTLNRKQGMLEHRRRRLEAVRQEMRLAEGMLARDFEDGTGEQLQALEAQHEALSDRLSRMQCRLTALQLLARELSDEIAQRRDAIAAPLAHRLSRLAQKLWPAADVPLTPELAVGGLCRDGQLEATGAISAGTREQVAVLSRLAYSGLLSEAGEAIPIILDDPLAFSDDDRLEALFKEMAEIAAVQQIIVLTCHARSFEPLISDFGANKLTLETSSRAVAA